MVCDETLDRARAMQGTTLVHIPRSMRDRFAAILADILEGTLANDQRWAELATCMPRLLLHAVPYGVTAAVELNTRLKLWEARDVEGLYLRILTQEAGRSKDVEEADDEDKRALAAARREDWPKRARWVRRSRT